MTFKSSISTKGFLKPARAPDVGPAPLLQWIPINQLVVDAAYQRPILGAGRQNVNRIAAHFDWTKFAPVIVAPIEGGLFAVVDGQHRTTAALLVGISSVPCQVIQADPSRQASAFRAINGSTTRVSALALHAAAIVAGDTDAVALDRVCREAGVEILRYPVSSDRIRPGQTLALEVLNKGWRTLGDRKFKRCLWCVTKTSNNVPGALCADVLRALFELHPRIAGIVDFDDRVNDAFWQIDLIARMRAAQAIKAQPDERRGVWLILAEIIGDLLSERGL